MSEKILYKHGLEKYDGKIKEYIANKYIEFSVDGTQSGSAISPVLRESDLVNNLTTTTPGAPLDAAQGKILKDLIDAGGGSSNTEIIADDYDSTTTYAVGDYCIYNNELYKCTTAISIAEAWDSSHWTKVNVSDELQSKMDKTNPTGVGSFSLNRKADTTIGNYSFAEGYNTTASGNYSHAEGAGTIASGYGSHAEGIAAIASGDYSHAEGIGTTASGMYSHAEGNHITAQRKSQHVFGEYNILDTGGTDTTTKGDYIEIAGNGARDSERSNARTLDWSGNEVLAGTLTTTDVNKPTGSTWDGTNTSLATAITSLNSTLFSIGNYTFTRQTIPIQTKIALAADGGTSLRNLLNTLPSVTAPSGYSFVSNLYMEISGAMGLTVIFDSGINIGAQTNINGFAFNTSKATIPSGLTVNVIIVSVWKKS